MREITCKLGNRGDGFRLVKKKKRGRLQRE